jgi:putative colanic acid biosynthesis glycosyltransferase WcaI
VRILLITRYFPPHPSNTASLLGELVEDLLPHHEVEVIAGRMPRDASERRSAGVRTLANLDSGGEGGRRTRIADYTSFALLAARAGRAAPRPDIVVTINDPFTSGPAAAVVAARHRSPLALICHDLYPDITVALGHRREGMPTAVWRGVNRRVYDRAGVIAVVGRDMLERLAGDGVSRAKLQFAPAWSEPQELDPGAAAGLRRDVGWDGRFVVMHAGSVGAATDVELCLDVASALSELPEVLFVFLGGGPAKPRMIELAARRGLTNVEFRAPLPKPRAQALMAAADLHLIALVPRLWGCGAPSKAYGIMAAGRPFVAAVDPGSEPALIADEHGCGFVVTAGSPDAAAAAIRAAIGNPALDAMGERGRTAVRTRYERSSGTTALRELLEEAVAGNGVATVAGLPRAAR